MSDESAGDDVIARRGKLLWWLIALSRPIRAMATHGRFMFAAQIMTKFIVDENFPQVFQCRKKCRDLDSAKVRPTSALYNASCISKRLSRTCNLVRIFWRIINANQIHFFRILFFDKKNFLIFPKLYFIYVHTDKILCVFSSDGTPRAICHWRSVWRRWVIFWGAHFILFLFQNSRNFVESCLLLFLFFFLFWSSKMQKKLTLTKIQTIFRRCVDEVVSVWRRFRVSRSE